MDIKNIYLVRHGETTSNLEQTWRTANEQLTQRGIEQAYTVGKRVKSLGVNQIVASTSARTIKTAQIIAEVTDLPFAGDDLFYEEKTPTSIQGLVHKKTADNVIEKYIQALLENSEDPNFHYEDEENLHERKVRIGKILEYFDKNASENLLIVTHGNILKMLAAYIILGDKCTAKELYLASQRLRTSNTGITKFFKTDDDMWRMLIWNDHAHFAE